MATQLDLAEAQLLGWQHGKHGHSLISLVQSMNLTKQLDLAEAQLLGWQHGKHGHSLISLVQSMNLTKIEWEKIKAQYPSTLNQDEKQEIDDFFLKNKK